eukprot:CAMPEP_0181205244 /NCGR_PEP_ID=MMETSP1096-20121128/20369_1 /TAXON_ID=156174 ORGANISM="Chrysochromulina ericina, Strain CCMP281" /NCGR_SAMPLE_ID=MMETSP1096 /ASSEMBLY_ACC=CAM_ASM_000453 /LENGTH=100 /DNA_ID=CAMNT_0023296005 /DNA_START=135 /DNA_END=437 /DNA_ORIENTATION=+
MARKIPEHYMEEVLLPTVQRSQSTSGSEPAHGNQDPVGREGVVGVAWRVFAFLGERTESQSRIRSEMCIWGVCVWGLCALGGCVLDGYRLDGPAYWMGAY